MIDTEQISPAVSNHALAAGRALRTLVLMSVLVGSVSLALAGLAAARTQKASSARALTLRTKFTRFGSNELNLIGGGSYVLAYGNDKSVLVDTRTGHRTTVVEAGCSIPEAVGGASILFLNSGPTCGQDTNDAYELYSITTGQTKALTVNPDPELSECSEMAEQIAAGCAPVTAVGADWVAFAPTCGQDHCGGPSYAFQNLATGATGTPSIDNSSTTIDLDSQTLTRSLCKGVTVPPDSNNERGSPSVTVDGRFAIATSAGGSYLEQCGSRLHESLTYTSYPGCWAGFCAPPSNSHAIIWESAPLRLSGIFLPSRQRFTIPVPAKVDPAPGPYVNGDQYSLVLAPHTLYVENNGNVWTTPIPSAPPRPKRSH
jgi:hypothetical protein